MTTRHREAVPRLSTREKPHVGLPSTFFLAGHAEEQQCSGDQRAKRQKTISENLTSFPDRGSSVECQNRSSGLTLMISYYHCTIIVTVPLVSNRWCNGGDGLAGGNRGVCRASTGKAGRRRTGELEMESRMRIGDREARGFSENIESNTGWLAGWAGLSVPETTYWFVTG